MQVTAETPPTSRPAPASANPAAAGDFLALLERIRAVPTSAAVRIASEKLKTASEIHASAAGLMEGYHDEQARRNARNTPDARARQLEGDAAKTDNARRDARAALEAARLANGSKALQHCANLAPEIRAELLHLLGQLDALADALADARKLAEREGAPISRLPRQFRASDAIRTFASHTRVYVR